MRTHRRPRSAVPRRRVPRAALTTVLPTVLAAALLAGCAGAGAGGGGGPAGAGEPELGPVAVDPATASIALPMDAYTDTEAEAVRMGRVQEGLVSRCMARYGFTYEGTPAAPPGGAAGEDRHRYLFGLADPAYAAAHGYDKGAGGERRAKPPAPPLSDSAYAVMHGEQRGAGPGGRVPDARTEEEAAGTDSGIEAGGRKVPAGGCGREAYRKLYAPTKDSVDLLFAFGLASEAHDRSKRDSRVVEVLAKWSACMDKTGYTGIKSPYDVVEKLGLADDKGGTKAVAAATADVACKREVNLVGVWAAVEKAYQERLVEEHAETLALYERQRDARFALAASLA
ncbi:hypothetical protein MTF65_18515 [Streptomyces sp. APSN-46.1]|uniref:hypothetical protein n=1 Tax=Streptomyces sp. APSN-46.1 TaxID=2929049 RepID=UPI001FB24A79|nr:hypothetical protein [Streptomyces sp. APSN-46.1]MCJ1679298.1 hypothetical protein [Streptomyces sp. APSN-46.1]